MHHSRHKSWPAAGHPRLHRNGATHTHTWGCPAMVAAHRLITKALMAIAKKKERAAVRRKMLRGWRLCIELFAHLPACRLTECMNRETLLALRSGLMRFSKEGVKSLPSKCSSHHTLV
ncbi:hypothetical protein MTO96_011816 [Rhipicephalus appendiculatus]